MNTINAICQTNYNTYVDHGEITKKLIEIEEAFNTIVSVNNVAENGFLFQR